MAKRTKKKVSTIRLITDPEKAREIISAIWNGTYDKTITYGELDHLVRISLTGVVCG